MQAERWMMDRKWSWKKQSWIFAGALFLLFSVFAWRQFYGFNKNDEIFYISTVYRFFQGDAMLVDEWNNVQMFAFVTWPLYCLFRLFLPSNEGIVVLFRLSYLVFQAAAASYCYRRMKRFGWVRILPALFYFVTTPYNINNFSYNTLAFGFVLLTLATIASEEELRVRDDILCGVFTAGAVLANPYVVFLFMGYGIICLSVSFWNRRKRKETIPALCVKNFFWMGVGSFLVLVLFLIFVFSRGSLEEIMETFSYIVMDSERQKDFWEKFAKYFIRIHRYYKILVYVTGALTVLWLCDRKRRVPSFIYLAVDLAASVPHIFYYGFMWEMVGVNYMLIPLAFPGFMAWLISFRRDNRLFFGWYIPALIYTLLAHFATNTGILTVSASYMLVSAASIILIWKAVERQRRRWMYVFTGCVLAVQFLACIYQRIFYVWGDEHLQYLDCKLTEGPMKGVYTSRENERLYLDVLQDMEELCLTREDKLFVIGIAPWIYLNTEAECAAYSTWEILEDDPLIPVYYEVRPEKLPTVVYFYEYEEADNGTELIHDFVEKGYKIRIMRRGIVLECRR